MGCMPPILTLPDQPELLSRGLGDLNSLDRIEKLQFLSHVGHILRLYESAYLHHLDGTLDPRFWGGVERAMGDIMAYPGMRSALDLRRHHLSPEFGRFVEALRPQNPLAVFGEADRSLDRGLGEASQAARDAVV